MKIVINKCYGGFGLSDQAYERLIELGIPVKRYDDESTNEEEVIYDRTLSPREGMNDVKFIESFGRYWDNLLRDKRNHPLLIQVVEELGESANARYAKLSIVEIPDGIEYDIDEYDGMEHVAEKHRTWS